MENKCIKITKLPRNMNQNDIIKRRVYNESFICPYCNNAENTSYDIKYWYGTEDECTSFMKNLFKEKHKWKKYIWECRKCGAEWESMPFRCDYSDDVIYEEVNMDE